MMVCNAFFRDCKIVQLLRESLGSKSCRTCMLVHVSAGIPHYNETLQVIQLAARIHRMKRRPTKVRERDRDTRDMRIINSYSFMLHLAVAVQHTNYVCVHLVYRLIFRRGFLKKDILICSFFSEMSGFQLRFF